MPTSIFYVQFCKRHVTDPETSILQHCKQLCLSASAVTVRKVRGGPLPTHFLLHTHSGVTLTPVRNFIQSYGARQSGRDYDCAVATPEVAAQFIA